MIYNRVELFNVAEAVALPGEPGVRLRRVPEAVAARLADESRSQYRQAAGCEIRFVADGKPVRLTLAGVGEGANAYLYFGDYAAESFRIGTEPATLELKPLFPHFLSDSRADRLADGRFAPHVWRLVLHGGDIRFIGLEGENVRPPREGETPKLRYLAYGTSITQGVAATHPELTYVRQVGSRLGADVLNLGAAGAAYCEPALADYIASREDWHFASLCVSVNMLNQGYTAAEFADRARYMAHTVAGRRPDKPVLCIGLLPSFHDRGLMWPGRDRRATADEYRAALKAVVESPGLPNLHYADGRELLTRPSGLTHDLLHPSDHGMIEIGERLASRFRSLLEGAGAPS